MKHAVWAMYIAVLVGGAGCSGPRQPAHEEERMWISEVRYQDAKTLTYLGSPSILKLADGTLLVTHDYFGPGAPLNHEGEEYLTSVYRSTDAGESWVLINHLSYIFWANLFEHRGSVYLFGTNAHDGSIVIRRSDDGGYTWTTSLDDTTGFLFQGGPKRTPPNYHCAPMPVVKHAGRIWRAFENNVNGGVARGFRSFVLSADEDADLLRADSWRMSNQLVYDQDADPPEFGDDSGWLEGYLVGWLEDTLVGWLEGNVVVGPDGQLWNILRLNSPPVLNKAAMVKITDEGRKVEFDPATGFIDMPCGASKFFILRDPDTGVYWSIANDMQTEPFPIRRNRNRLSLFSSTDLRNWTRRKVLLDHTMPTPEEAVESTGFQYVSWQFDGEDIIYLVRTAYDGAHNFHDANRITFDRIESFRRLAE